MALVSVRFFFNVLIALAVGRMSKFYLASLGFSLHFFHDRVHGEFLNQAAMGVWNNPRQCFCHA